MPFRVLLHPKALTALRLLAPDEMKRVKTALRKLEEDPITRRSGADIKKLKGTHGRKDLHRLRVGEVCAVYEVAGKEILVTDIFRRGDGYEV